MKLFKRAKDFDRNEDGAVTVDWVVLTASIVGLAIAVMATVRSGTEGLASRISEGFGSITTD